MPIGCGLIGRRKFKKRLIERIQQCLSGEGVKKKTHIYSDIYIVKVGSFADAYCFFLTMCDIRFMTFRKIAGYCYYTVVLPGRLGNMELTDKTGCFNKKQVAVLRMNLRKIVPEIKEIRFVLTGKNKKTYENN